MGVSAYPGVTDDYTPYPMDCSADWSAKRKREEDDSTQDRICPAGMLDEFQEIGIG